MSNKKSQLNESTIRRFMKLASISPLTENFLDKNELEEEVTEEDAVTEDKEEETVSESTEEEPVTESTEDEPVTEGDNGDETVVEDTKEELTEMGLEPADRDEEELTVADDAPEGEPGDMDMDMPEEPAAAEGGEALAQEVATAVADALQDVLGVEVNVTGDAEEEPEMDLPAEEPEMDLPVEDEEEPVMEDETTAAYNRDEMIAEVTRRVTERIKQKMRKEQIAEELANRIFSRLADKKG